VRLHSARVMETGEPLLLRLVPETGPDEPVVDGTVTAHNPCHSGGAIEIFLDPCLPPPRVVVVGDAPVAQALRELAPGVGLEAVDGPSAAEDLALVVASHGRDEEPALAAALSEGVPYVGLVASERRGEKVRAALDVPDDLRERLRTPAGLPIGAHTPAEIALSVLAAIVQERRAAVPDLTPVEAHHRCHDH
jgi:xanthine dehydrogenase accessory factor